MKKVFMFAVLALFASSALMIQSCSKDDDPVVVVKPTLYDSLGGSTMVADPKNSSAQIEKGRLLVRSIIDSTIFVIAADAKINGFFKVLLAEVTAGNTTGFAALSKSLVDFVCVGTGAKNFTYTGRNMTAAHDPAQNPRMNGKAGNADMDAFEADLVAGAAKAGVPASTPALQSVAKIVESLRSVVVQK